VRRGKTPEDADADMVDGLLGFIAQANQAGGGKDGEDGPSFTRDNVKAVMMVRYYNGPNYYLLILLSQNIRRMN
jgi:ferulate-5-hydroxylase